METNELQTKLVLWLENAAQAIGDFAVKEIPPVMHEYLQWKFFEACYWAIFPIICFIIGALIFRYGMKLIKDPKCDYDGVEIVPSVIGAVVVFVATIAILASSVSRIKTAIQIKVAPKVYLIEQASDIIKGKK